MHQLDFTKLRLKLKKNPEGNTHDPSPGSALSASISGLDVSTGTSVLALPRAIAQILLGPSRSVPSRHVIQPTHFGTANSRDVTCCAVLTRMSRHARDAFITCTQHARIICAVRGRSAYRVESPRRHNIITYRNMLVPARN